MNYSHLVRAGPYYDAIRELMLKSKWIGSDETGIRVKNENWFLWVWQNNLFSYFVSHKRRAHEVVKEYFGEVFKGTLIHDCFGSQNKTEAGNHQHCHLHYLRPLVNHLIKNGTDTICVAGTTGESPTLTH